MLFEGKRVNIHGPRDAAKLGIEVVYQDLALADNLDVVANMFLGRERVRTGVVLDESSMERVRPRDARQPLGHDAPLGPPDASPASPAASGRRSRSRSRSCGTRELVILDEPTAALGVAQTRQVLDLVRRLARTGPRRRDHLAQPPRHLRGRRPDHRAPPRPARRAVRDGRRRPSRRSSTRSPPARSAHVPGMARPRRRSTHDRADARPIPPAAASEPTAAQSPRPGERRRRGASRRFLRRLVAGRPGRRARVAADHRRPRRHRRSSSASSTTRSSPQRNFTNLLLQMAADRDDRHRRRLRAADRRDRPLGRAS